MRHTAHRAIHAALATSSGLAHAALGHLPLLRHTLATAHRVQIAYVKDGGEASVRIIEPEEVRRSKTGDWYVRAHDLLRDATRSFRLDRITAYTETA
ncbi:WYL domain-containing protein [Streptomyces sp. ME19-01-6]|uniref:WYL domain-containing protein n=1 Tax=Streptomyces sp. ME19-01-6 TaxID=3028686 RepID=UPI0029B5C0C4|nr:WYL domain-containing protein [Streptomyces sp. ME19-01-6]MDX3232917.1 WYL domain-containing protein [Streptomyces sp. ME19-01-6]